MKKNLTYLLMCVFLLGACTEGKKEAVPLTLNVKQALSHPRRFDLEREAKQIDFVPLETRKECMVGELRKVIKRKDFLFVADLNCNLFLFDTNGKFIRKIGSIGKGIGEYPLLFDFDVDSKTNDVYINAGGKLMVYSVDGQYKNSIELGTTSLQVFCLNQSGKAMSLYPDATSELDSVDLVQINDLTTGKRECIKSGVVRKTGIVFFSWIYSKDNSTYYKPELDNCIYRLDENNRKSTFLELNFEDLAFTENLFHYEAMQQWDKYYRVNGFLNLRSQMFLNLQKGLMGKELTTLIYDKEKKEFYCPENSEGKDGLFVDGIRLELLADEGQNLICSLSVADALQQKEVAHNPALKEVLGGIDMNSNPVLAICEF